MDSILPPGSEPMGFTMGTDSETDIRFSVENGTDGKISVSLGTGSEKAIQAAVDNILEKSKAGESITIDNGTEKIVLEPKQVQELYDTISKYVDPELLEMIA